MRYHNAEFTLRKILKMLYSSLFTYYSIRFLNLFVNKKPFFVRILRVLKCVLNFIKQMPYNIKCDLKEQLILLRFFVQFDRLPIFYHKTVYHHLALPVYHHTTLYILIARGNSGKFQIVPRNEICGDFSPLPPACAGPPSPSGDGHKNHKFIYRRWF